MAIPGVADSKGFESRWVRPSLTMEPQAALGGSIPTPRKLSPASARIAAPICIVTNTISGGKQLGSTC